MNRRSFSRMTFRPVGEVAADQARKLREPVRTPSSLLLGPVIPLYEWMRRGDACIAPTGWPARSRALHASRRA